MPAKGTRWRLPERNAARLAFAPLVLSLLVAIPVTVTAQQQQLYSISGIAYFDRNANGVRDTSEPPMSAISIEVQGLNGAIALSTSQTKSQDDGSYGSSVLAGTYTIQARVLAPGPRTVLSSLPKTVTITNSNVSGIDLGLTSTPQPRDERYFPQTRYRVDDDAIWSYFQSRGGVQTFGYPISRTFPFLAFWTQIFQRQVLVDFEGVSRLNLLDPTFMPLTSINSLRFPVFDTELVSQAPSPFSPTYAADVSSFIQQQAPDTFDGLPVNFGHTFTQTVALQTAYPNGNGDAALLPLLNLEIWGMPTSHPAYDPNNHNFVYQRFQRGIMHFDRGCNCTRGILLADVFKAVLTGDNVPPDVAVQLNGSPFLRLYDPTRVNALAPRSGPVVAGLPGTNGQTDLAFAFTTG